MLNLVFWRPVEPAFLDKADSRHFPSILGNFSKFGKKFNLFKCHIFVSKKFWDIKSRRKTQISEQMCISYILFVDIDAKPPKGGNLGCSTIFENSRFLTFLRKSPSCGMNVTYPSYERACVAQSGSRNRQALNFVDFHQILIKNWIFVFLGCSRKILLMNLHQQKSKKYLHQQIYKLIPDIFHVVDEVQWCWHL